MVVENLNTAKITILKLIEEIPETKAGEIIDFLEYLKQKKEYDLFIDEDEENELWNLIENDERISLEQAEKSILGD